MRQKTHLFEVLQTYTKYKEYVRIETGFETGFSANLFICKPVPNCKPVYPTFHLFHLSIFHCFAVMSSQSQGVWKTLCLRRSTNQNMTLRNVYFIFCWICIRIYIWKLQCMQLIILLGFFLQQGYVFFILGLANGVSW